jgi:primosomal protein N' (replication factor Y)
MRTQMISKGLISQNVYLVGLFRDIGLMNPDFRSNERTFQLLSQVASDAQGGPATTGKL